jgi:hypothetical protein
MDRSIFERCRRFGAMESSAAMEAFREPRLRRARRQAITIGRAIRAGRARAKVIPPTRQIHGTALQDRLAELAADAQLVDIPVNRPPWTTTSMHVASGERVTWLAWGFAYLVKPLGIGAWPRNTLRGRVGGGAVQASARDTFTFAADRSGPVELGSMLPGEMRDDGSIATDRIPYRAMRGSLTAVIVRWKLETDPRQALETVAGRDSSGLCATEAARLADPPKPPAGWHHHPLLWPEEVYAASEASVAARVRQTADIVRRPAEAPLTPTLRLRWSWRLEALPSKLPEDTMLTHDYLSVALEFDDGHDLTWHWSCALPEGFAYRCPLDHWRHRETHVVVRSGTAALGRWVDEERRVLADHQVAIGGPVPARVVRAWLISVSTFQRGEGRGEFGRIELVDGDRVVRVL